MTVIGLGPMGRALAESLLRSGHPTTVWNRTPGKADQLVGQGAHLAGSAAEALAANGVAVLCLIDGAAVDSVLDRAARETDLSGLVVVNLTADTPELTRELDARLAERGVTLLDGAIMTGAETIGTRATRVLYSGPRDTYEAHRDLLSAFGGTAHYLGSEVSAAATYDVALLSQFWTSIGGVAHALAYARAQGLDVNLVAPHAAAMSRLAADVLPELASDLVEGSFSGVDSSSLDSVSASLGHLRAAMTAAGVPEGVLEATHAVVERARDAGYGGDSPSRLADVLDPRAADGS